MSDLDEAPRAAEEHVDPEPVTEPMERVRTAQDAAILELQRRHQMIAAELGRLSTILEAAGRPPRELDEGSETAGSSALAAAYETAPLPSSGWERAQGGMQRSAGVQPEAQRVIHLGTERSQLQARPRGLAVGLGAGAVGAVVAAALIMLLLAPRWSQPQPGFSNTVTGVATEAAVAETAAPPAVAPAPSPVATAPTEAPSSAALDAILAGARSVPSLPEETDELVRRLPALSALSGLSRSEEATDIYGLAVTAARTDSTGIASDIAAALEPEITIDSIIALAQRRPDVVGAGVAPLLDGFASLPTLPPERQQEEAQELMDAVADGVMAQTIAGPYCNSVAKALGDYGAEPPPA
jgi:hypothetical protein